MSKMEEIEVGDVIVHRKNKTAWQVLALCPPNGVSLQSLDGQINITKSLRTVFDNYRHEHGRERHERLNREAKAQ